MLAHRLRRWPNIGQALSKLMCRIPANTTYIYPMFDQCWPTVYDVGPNIGQTLGRCVVFAVFPLSRSRIRVFCLTSLVRISTPPRIPCPVSLSGRPAAAPQHPRSRRTLRLCGTRYPCSPLAFRITGDALSVWRHL